MAEKDKGFQMLFSYDNFIHAFAGATGSVVAMTAFYPFDTVRTRLQADDSLKSMGPLQAMKQLTKEEGVDTLYRGLSPVLSSLYCSNFVYFYVFNGMKTLAIIKGLKASSGKDLLFGYISGCINALVTTPLWVANTRLKLQGVKSSDNSQQNVKRTELKGLIHGVCTIAEEEGVAALWNGVQTSFILSGNPAIHFMVYEALKRVLLRSKIRSGKNLQLSSLESFLLGGFAKAVATVLTYPLQLVQCRQRAYRSNGSNLSVSQIIAHVLRNSGLWGLFKGMETKLVQTVLTAALMFLTYEKIVSLIYMLLSSKKSKYRLNK
ncbi:peroxisomal membrane protein PMP34 [Hydra vulgaris]|nr:peroxisomal membrane protein PMP34 [Hydra vulgaris]